MATLKSSTPPPSSGQDPQGELSRELSLFHITMMGLGMMIGAGVFIGMGVSISRAGPGGVILTFALNGLLAMFTAMSFAELSSAIPRAGGVYNFARVGFGRQASFLAGWMEWFASSVAGSMYAMTFALYTILFYKTVIMNQAGADIAVIGWQEKLLAVCTALLFIYINFKGASETGKIGALITIGQTIFVVVIGLVGVGTAIAHPERLSNFDPYMPHGWLILLATMGFTSVAFEGYEVIAQAGDEAKDPKCNLPKAMLFSVLIVTIIYVLVAFAVVVSVDPNDPVLGDKTPASWIGEAKEKGFKRAIENLMPFGNLILTLAVIFSATSALNATVYSATRASYALGRDKMLPKVFARIHPIKKTPFGALLCTSFIVLFSIVALPVEDLVASASIMFLFLFFLANLCVIKIRRNMADELEYGFIMPLFPLFPILAITFQVLLAAWLVHMSFVAWIVAPIWVGSGFLIYHLYAKHHAVTTEDEIQILEEHRHRITEVQGKYPIMVAVANPANAESLMKNTFHLCQAKDAHVELIHMISVPDQIALADGRQSLPGREAMEVVMRQLSAHFPISTTIRYCRNAARGIVAAIREKRSGMLVLGWHGQTSQALFCLGSTIDPIVEQSPCDIVVFKDCHEETMYRRVLVPLAGGPNGGLALEIAHILCERSPWETMITALNVDTGREFDISQYVKEHATRLNLDPDRFQIRTVAGTNPAETILKESEDYDLVVLGTTDKPLLVQFATGSIPEEIARQCKKPTVIVKANVGVRSWIKRWI